MKFTAHKYTWSKPFASVRHSWSLRGPRGGIEFNVSIMDDEEKHPDPSCGLEFHHTFDPKGGQQACQHIDCHITGGPCWHEGTSLYASEGVWPQVKHYLKNGDHAAVMSRLEWEYDRHFEQYEATQ